MRLFFPVSRGIFQMSPKNNLFINNQTKLFFFRCFSRFLSKNPVFFRSTREQKITQKQNIFAFPFLSSTKQSLSTQCFDLSCINTQKTRKHHVNLRSSKTRLFSCGPSAKSDFIFRQLLDYKSFTYTYLLADAKSMEGVIIDPVLDNVDRDLKIIDDLGVKLLIAMNTHVHADHITGTGLIKNAISSCKSYISSESKAKADEYFHHGSKIPFGSFNLECRSTPGHTNGCYSFVWHEKHMVFTGDAVLIRGCGRTDFQQGDAEKLYDSVHKQIFSLPSHYLLFPAHDYTGQTMSTVGEEKDHNPRLTRTKSGFVKIMQDLQLPYPDQIDKSLPANLLCGIQSDMP